MTTTPTTDNLDDANKNKPSLEEVNTDAANNEATDSEKELAAETAEASTHEKAKQSEQLNLAPRAIVDELNRHIIGQQDAKRAVAIALRNRWRRMNIEDEQLRREIMPKNILMIGPTGVGKTEIARRLARLAGAPFIKIEATKFTEVGYVGRDVESIIRDLADIAVKQTREREMEKVQDKALERAKERVLDKLVPTGRNKFAGAPEGVKDDSNTRKAFRKQLEQGFLDDEEIEVEATMSVGVEIMAPPGMEDMTNQLQSLFQNFGGDKTQKRRMRIKEALKVLREDEAAKLINEDDIKAEALRAVEQNGIVFLDEIDKVAKSHENRSGDVSREGVQRDLLPLVEGSTVSTKHGMIKTDHVLFIASGAFQLAKPSDLIPELQGRLPIRVELGALSAEDFVRILTEPDACLTEQYTALMQTENVTLDFKDDAIKRLAEVAWQVNDKTENIGARRLYTVMERLLEVISFEATERSGETIAIDAAYVNEHLGELVQDEDLTRYIL